MKDGPTILLMLVLVTFGALGQDMPLRKQAGDIEIWEDQYLRGPPKGWIAPEDYHSSHGRGSPVLNAVRFGRFGAISGRFVYSSWRPIVPLTDEQYAEGKVKLRDNHRSEAQTPPFEITLDYITFLISGANKPGEACVNLLVDGKVMRTATGRNSDVLKPMAFDVRALKGKQAQIQVLDSSTDALVYITIDCIYQSVDPKGATRVIAESPGEVAAAGRIKTVSGTTTGPIAVADGVLTIGEQRVNLDQLIELDTGVVGEGPDSTSRVMLTNGDLLASEITGLDTSTLKLVQPMLGPLELAFDHVAQAIFLPGPTVNANPGTLVQINNRLIPGKLKWIREDTIAIDCSLGLVPLPRTRVRSFALNRVMENEARDRVAFADGSVLTGALGSNEHGLVLIHAVLGELSLDLERLAGITRRSSKALAMTGLQAEVVERTGPILPPLPEASGESLRMFPGTVVRYTLPAAEQPRWLRAKLLPLSGSQAALSVTVRVNGKTRTFSVASDAGVQAVEVDLGTAAILEIEVQLDAGQAIAFPSGIEWRSAMIIEGGA